MEHSMRAMIAFVLLGLASAPLAAQANPPPPSNPPVAQPTDPQYQGPPPQAPQAQSPQPQGPQYSSNEIVEAGHRFFGTISRELAQIVEKAGSQFGLPNGYVLGQEGGGAVVAGLRYGEGILYTKNAGDLRVFWQGPSLGYDFGVDGARTMMLVYNLPSPDAIYQRFAGIEGSAYFVGGLGMTALTMNNIVVFPIREIGTVRDKTAARDIVTKRVDRRQAVPRRQRDDQFAMQVRQRVRRDDEASIR